MPDKLPHFMHAHRARCKQRKRSAPLIWCAAVFASLLSAPVFHGEAQAAYFSSRTDSADCTANPSVCTRQGVFNHMRSLGEGEQPQLTPLVSNRDQIQSSFEQAFSVNPVSGFRETNIRNRGTGTGRYRRIVYAIQIGGISYDAATGRVNCTSCTKTGPTNSVNTIPASFFAVLPDRLEMTQTVEGDDRRVTVRIISPLNRLSPSASDGNISVNRPAIATASFSVYVGGVRTALSAGDLTVNDDDTQNIMATITIRDAASQPTSVTFATSTQYAGPVNP